jgi:hypothetical protein
LEDLLLIVGELNTVLDKVEELGFFIAMFPFLILIFLLNLVFGMAADPCQE